MANPGAPRPVDAFFPRRREAILADECAYCPATNVVNFHDPQSEREYRITGQCQQCQNNLLEGE